MANSERFNIELPADLAAFVHSQVGQGTLTSDADVVREAVRVLQRQASRLTELRATVKAAIDDPRPSLTDEEVGQRLRQRADALRRTNGTVRRLVYRASAEDDLEEILEFIARDNVDRALYFTDELRGQCRRVASLPGTLGTARPELHPGLRSFAYKGYVILFRYGAGRVEVVKILEGHRDIDALFRT